MVVNVASKASSGFESLGLAAPDEAGCEDDFMARSVSIRRANVGVGALLEEAASVCVTVR